MFIASPVQVQACMTLIAYYDGHYRRFTGLCTHHLWILIGHRDTNVERNPHNPERYPITRSITPSPGAKSNQSPFLHGAYPVQWNCRRYCLSTLRIWTIQATFVTKITPIWSHRPTQNIQRLLVRRRWFYGCLRLKNRRRTLVRFWCTWRCTNASHGRRTLVFFNATGPTT